VQTPIPGDRLTGLRSKGLAWLAVAGVIAALTGARLWYLTTPLAPDLSADEAHYWDWSRRLDWSYYSKGPLVAWLIRLSCFCWGSDSMLAVRTPAIFCSALTLLGLAVLTWQATQRMSAVFLATVLVGTYPAFSVGALLMTIDAPYLCCWTWALVLTVTLLQRTPAAIGSEHLGRERKNGNGDVLRRNGAWLALGLIVGLGILAKYTMVLFVPALLVFLLMSPASRSELQRGGPWLMIATAALCCAPIVIWNAQHDWVTLRHVGGQAGLNSSEFGQRDSAWFWTGPLEYLFGQAGLLLGVWFLVFISAVLSSLRRRSAAAYDFYQNAKQMLAVMALVVFVFFGLFSFKTKVQLNWPVAAYLAGVPLMAAWLTSPHATAERRWWLIACGVVATLGTALTVVAHSSVFLHEPVQRLTGLAPRRWDPTCRLRGWRELASAVEQMRIQLRANGTEPILAGSAWNLPGILAFYLPDQPTVYHVGPAAGQRQSQYEIWRPQPTSDPQVFLGRCFIIVGPTPPAFETAFERLERLPPLTFGKPGQEVATHFLTIAHGFRGFRAGKNATFVPLGPSDAGEAPSSLALSPILPRFPKVE
jgi:4-amino-4-deoxy-L-arabinose transferase-like glycosyltransferase